MSVTRVAVIFEQLDTKWLGGLNYFSNLIRSVSEASETNIEIIIFAGKKINLYGMDAYASVVRSGFLDKRSSLRFFRKSTERLIQKDIALYLLLKRHNIDCISHFGKLWSNCPIPSLTWIADLQHKRLPGFFDKSEITRRNRLHSRLLSSGSNVLLSSQSAANDFSRFYPEHRSRVYILRFISSIPTNWTPRPKSELIEKYKLKNNWFHVPNQFWAHKNHQVVVDAAHLLKNRNIDSQVVSTGNIVDPRHPSYFDDLSRKINHNELNECFKILGTVPYDDVLSIMFHSLAVINPSLFEGWSTTVEEAKSMGKMIVLSNIDTHVEQSPKRVLYFNPDDSLELANHLEFVKDQYSVAVEEMEFKSSMNELPIRQKQFSRAYESIILNLVQKDSSPIAADEA